MARRQRQMCIRDSFVADAPLPLTSIYDRGFMAEMGYMVVPKRLNLDVFGGYVSDQFRRFPWELGGGLNYYPSGTRSWRLNLHVMHVDKSLSLIHISEPT